jgi:hypothetical protein
MASPDPAAAEKHRSGSDYITLFDTKTYLSNFYDLDKNPYLHRNLQMMHQLVGKQS